MKLFSPARPAVLVSVTIGALLAATGGLALAGAAPHGGIVHLCVEQATGTLRVAVQCRPGEKQLILNQRGPAGLRGKPGKRGKNGKNGVNGTPGLRGPSDAWSVSGTKANTGNDSSNNITASPVTLASDTLPGGNFVAYATVDLETSADPGTSDVPVNTFCTLSAGSLTYTDRLQLQVPALRPDNPALEAPLALSIAGQVGAGTTLHLTCQAAPGSFPMVPVQFSMTAIRVGDLH